MDKIIDARYRRRGYQVYWLLLGRPNNKAIPFLDRFPDQLSPADEDVIIPAGICFRSLTLQRIKPKPSYVLKQLPRPTSHLVLGGFHRYECVEQFATSARVSGVNTDIDDDLTDQFFRITNEQGEIPLIRQEIRPVY
ncbi:MAG: hypothetical protein Q8P30_01815 [Candidatus Uhrbacteria bacterium]|nr:hypothetical protein [Candidatus Uhrbacteria bacterium]